MPMMYLPLDKLVPGAKAPGGSINSRKAEVPIDGLAASIAAHGLLVPLLVRRAADDKFLVADGNRRLAAMTMLHKPKKGAPAEAEPVMVPCVEINAASNANALEISAVVNVDREELHPVDRFEVLSALIEAGDTVDGICRRYPLTVKQVRQALALARMAPAVRDAWRGGHISSETAEAFTLTSDHKAQAAALKKIGKHGSVWQVRQALVGNNADRVGSLLAFVGRDKYEAAGHQINETLFNEREDGDTVSDVAALRRMADEKIEQHCALLIQQGWKWAITKSSAPRDVDAWKRIHPDGPQYTKEMMGGLGCVVDLDYQGKLDVRRGYVKPGDKVALPKSPKQKKAAAAAKEQQKEETGGLSNALAFRLSQQLTAAVREAFAAGVSADDAVSFTIAALACSDGPTSLLRVVGDDDDGRHDNDFVKYYRLARGKPTAERFKLLASWLARTIDMTSHQAPHLVSLLHPGKEDDRGALVLVEQINPREMTKAAVKHFDLGDYLSSVSKDLVVEAVRDALGKEHAERVAKMKAGDAKAYAAKHMSKTGWVPETFRL